MIMTPTECRVLPDRRHSSLAEKEKVCDSEGVSSVLVTGGSI